MKIFAMIRAELARLTATTMSRIALFALLLVPVLYGGLYLWANQNPYAGLDRVPVALVVADSGASIDGTAHNFGDEVADKLIADHSFQWHRVSQRVAAAGVADATYDFSVTLPADFSESISSPTGSDPHQATVTLTTNDANSYLASTIGTQAVKTIREAIAAKVSAQAAERFLVGLADIRSNLVTAAQGASSLADGAAEASAGASRLAGGAAALATGTAAVADGADSLASGAGTLASGADQVSAGARQVADGNQQLATAADRAGAAAAQAVATVPAVRSQIVSALQAAGVDQAQIDQVTSRLDSVGGDITAANTTVQTAVGQIDQLATGSEQVADGAARVASGAGQLAQGSTALSDGAHRAATGAAELSSGAASLRDGLGSLSSGAEKLRDGLNTGVNAIPDISEATRSKQAHTIANPVHIASTELTSAGTYGAGLAPFFASLAAWIGIYALFLIVKPVSRRAITALHTPLRITLAGWLTPGLLGALQMAGLFAVLTRVLQFDVHSPLATYSMMALASLAFAAIILALNIWLGSVGQFLGLVLMVVQLVAAGGTFPWQTLPAPLAFLHHVLPMSYAVDGIRQLMYGGEWSAAMGDAGVLLLWLGGALAFAAIGVIRMTHFRTLRDLRPSLIG